MVYKIYLLLGMIFCHIIDDYYLQGILASMKQRRWWEENAPDKMYKYDYLMALFMHSFSWAFMVMLIPAVYNIILDRNNGWMIIAYFYFNLSIHFSIDNLKANKFSINLIKDQLFHLTQIVMTWVYTIVL